MCHPGLLAQRVYTSLLLGCEAALGLHGGGNTGVKVRQCDLFVTTRISSTSRAAVGTSDLIENA